MKKKSKTYKNHHFHHRFNIHSTIRASFKTFSSSFDSAKHFARDFVFSTRIISSYTVENIQSHESLF